MSSLAFQAQAYYHPDEGRWISRDPIGELGNVDLYGYVQNNPINLWDVLGLACCCQDYDVQFMPGGDKFQWDIYAHNGMKKVGNKITGKAEVLGNIEECKCGITENGKAVLKVRVAPLIWKTINTVVSKNASTTRKCKKGVDHLGSAIEIWNPSFNGIYHLAVKITQVWTCTGTDGKTVSKTITVDSATKFTVDAPTVTIP
jgi:hypothetical protein